MVGRAGVDLDALHHHGKLDTLEQAGLPHDVFAREVVAAVLQDLDRQLADQIAEDGLAVGLAHAREIALHEGAPFAEHRLAGRCRVFALEPVGRRQQAFRILRARRLNHGRVRIGDRGGELQRPPTEFGGSLDRHDREFRRGELDEDVGAGGLELGHLGVDGGVGHLVWRLGHDRHLATEAVLQPLQIFLAHAILLIEDGDPAAGMVLQQILRKNLRFSRVGRQEADGPGKLVRLVPGRRTRQGKQVRDLF